MCTRGAVRCDACERTVNRSGTAAPPSAPVTRKIITIIFRKKKKSIVKRFFFRESIDTHTHDLHKNI